MSEPTAMAIEYALFAILGKGFLLGLSLAVPIGPINLEIIRRGLAERPNAGWALGLGACTVDGAYALLAGAGLAWLMQEPALVVACQAAGALLLTWMGWGALRSGQQQWQTATAEAPETPNTGTPQSLAMRPLWKHYVTGLAMTATAPMNIVFWLTVPARFFRGQTPTMGMLLLTSLAVLSGTFCWVTSLRGLICLGRRWVRPRLLAGLSLAGGAALLGFACWAAWGAFSTFCSLAQRT